MSSGEFRMTILTALCHYHFQANCYTFGTLIHHNFVMQCLIIVKSLYWFMSSSGLLTVENV